MELTATVHVPRRHEAVEVVVAWNGAATADDLRQALAEHLGIPVPGLLHEGERVPVSAPVGAPPLLHGVSLVVAETGEGSTPGSGGRPACASSSAMLLTTVGGPDAGRAVPLRPPGLSVGRAELADLRLADPSLSRVHCRIDADPSGVRVRDEGSTNGVWVDGRPLDGVAEIDTRSEVRVGATTLRLRRAPAPGPPRHHPGDGTARVPVGITPAPRRQAPTLTAPRTPTPPTRARLPWVAALAPLPIVVGLAFFIGPQVLAFALLGPVVLLSTGVGDRVGGRRRHRRALAEHAESLARHRETVTAALQSERAVLLADHPDAHEVLTTAVHGGPRLWSGAEGPVLRLGLGRVDAGLTVTDPEGAEHHPHLDDAPVRLDLSRVGALHVQGPALDGAALLRHLVGQVVVAHGPESVSLELVRPADPGGWRVLDLLPHRHGSGRRLLVVPDSAVPDAAPRIAGTLADGGLCLSAGPGPAPTGSAAVLRHDGGGRYTLTGPGTAAALVADGTSEGWLDRLVRALAPLRPDEPGRALLPAVARSSELLGLGTDPDAVLRRWATATAPTATVGVDADGPWSLDLHRDGPHVLVGGTTGSGKSELLRTLVTGLALDSSPDDVTLLLVDFKGGAAFGPCVDLPHVVGLVTDLDSHLVDRMLDSLAAELRRREQVLADLGASDIDAARRLAGHDAAPLPRLVVVVDEVRALVDAHPDAVGSLVRLAAQGRSLGIHLVLATQRPTGTLGAEIQANVTLRIAFRVRDRADSCLVVESDDAALVPPDRPGRGVRRGGDGVLRPFQAALVAPADTRPPQVRVRAAAGGRVPEPAPHPPSAAPQGEDAVTGRDTEVRAVVDLVRRAARALGSTPPRRPWMPPLPAVAPAAEHPAGTVALVDEPDRQRRCAWVWSSGTPTWRVVGPSRSGRTATLRALVLAAVAAHDEPLEIHLIAPPGLGELAALPQVGSVVDPTDPVGVDALLSRLEQSSGSVHGSTTLLVVDGVDRLEDDPGPATSGRERVLRLVRDTDVHALLAGGRDLLRPTWAALGGETLLLGRPDALDAALLGLPATPTPSAAPPGRGWRAPDHREVQVLLVGPDDVVAAAGGSAVTTPPTLPWTYRPLPTRVDRADVPEDPAAPPDDGLLVGLAGPRAAAFSWRPAEHGRLLLVTGRSRSGRTTALRVLARSSVGRGRPLVLVTGRPTVRPMPSLAVPEGPPPPWPVLGPDDAERLVDLRRAHPDLLVLVDDVHLLDHTDMGRVLDEIASLVERDGGALAVSSPSRVLAGRLRGLDVTVARLGSAVLLQPALDDAALVGIPRAAVARATGGPPGRGLLVVDGEATPLQVLADGADDHEPATTAESGATTTAA
ncbi:FtsK/SpoIIIE domain-containing protein [Phycicoccus jejuensis]|uniref:FtsK/SpoIIIE domain-containing protein n=1 Tax=Phycicoccus jejuensis TaxID=367299 RepID=UPI0004C32063|nr:FtsK/SpoIIIE domain-containing protein [Phycicoccus jejuensis]